jgi:hypothetical protein
MKGTKEIRITLSQAEYSDLIDAKNGRTWKEVLQDGAAE